MKKIMIIVALFCAVSCTTDDFEQEYENDNVETRAAYTAEQLAAIEVLYASCVQFFELPAEYQYENPTLEQKILIIRYCDMVDAAGDFLCEIPEYDDIATILWPNGYGESY